MYVYTGNGSYEIIAQNVSKHQLHASFNLPISVKLRCDDGSGCVINGCWETLGGLHQLQQSRGQCDCRGRGCLQHPTCGGYRFGQPVQVQKQQDQGAGTRRRRIRITTTTTNSTSSHCTSTSSRCTSSSTSTSSCASTSPTDILGHPPAELRLQHRLVLKVCECACT
jgi:hypothetical protein